MAIIDGLTLKDEDGETLIVEVFGEQGAEFLALSAANETDGNHSVTTTLHLCRDDALALWKFVLERMAAAQ